MKMPRDSKRPTRRDKTGEIGTLLLGIAVGMLLGAPSVTLTGCSAPWDGEIQEDTDRTDDMSVALVNDADLWVLRVGDSVIDLESMEAVDVPAEDMEDGGFYHVVADVEFLDGGIAGYVRHPEVKSIKSVTPEEPDLSGIPAIGEGQDGLLRMGDYADGDFVLNSDAGCGVLKDGHWIAVYEKPIRLPDGSVALVANDEVTEDEVVAGLGTGIVSCERWFVIPAPGAVAGDGQPSV